MAATTVQADAAPMSEVSRLINVFFEPKKAFADIAQRPRWIVPLLIAIVFGAGYIYAFNKHVGWEPYLHRLFDTNPQVQRLPAEQREQVFQMQLRVVPITSIAGAVVFTPVMFLVGSAIVLGIIKGLMGAPIKFKQAFAVFAYAWLPHSIYLVLSTVVMFVTKNPEDFDLQNGFFSNPGAFMDPMTANKFLRAVANNLDVFVIWTLLLIATGLAAAGGKKLSYGGALFAVVLPFAVYVLIRGAAAAAGFGG
jgi:Yip1 domain